MTATVEQLFPEVSEREVLARIASTVNELQPDAGFTRVALDSALDRDLGLDSLSRMELVLRLEQAFGVSVAEDTLQTAETVRDLLAALTHAADRVGRPRALAEAPAVVVKAPSRGVIEHAPPETAATINDVLAWHASTRPDEVQIVHLADDVETRITCERLATGARAVAGGLQRIGLAPRQCVAIMLPTSPAYFDVYLGILLAGAIPVPIYPPARASQLEEHVLRHAGILFNAQAVLLVTVPEAKLVARLLQARVPCIRHIVAPDELAAAEATFEPVAVRGEDIAFIQYTSGSTGNPKGVVLTHDNLLANIRAMQTVTQVTARDVFVSWLPLYHDMGLIGAFLGSLYVGMTLVVMSPLAFLARPERWLWAIHRYRGTLSAGPNFAYELAVRRVPDTALDGLDLSCWRIAFNGAEAVNADTMTRFADRFGRCGLRPQALTPVYGLAEASVGLLFPPLGRGLVIDHIDRSVFMQQHRAQPVQQRDPHALQFVACGRPLPGHDVRIVDDAASEVGERVEGRLEFKGPSATSGYFRNTAETRRLFHDDWLDTGDRAYRADGDVFVTGRVKDIVIRGGRNLYPDEIEAAVGAIDGVRRGCVAVFGVPDESTGTERLVILAETRLDDKPAREKARAAIVETVVAVLGEPPDEVILAPPHTVLKTSSGKIRRSACRDLLLRGAIGASTPSARLQFFRLATGALGARARHAFVALADFGSSLRILAAFWAIAAPAWLLTVATRDTAAAWSVGRAAARLLLRGANLPLTVTGLERLPAGPCVVVSNHASYADGVLLVAALPRPFAFVAKRELRDQFIAGRYLRHLGAEFVERTDVKRSVEDAQRMADLVSNGKSLMIFPEGTFVTHEELLPFRLGAFLAAARAQVPVVPVAIRGSRELLSAGAFWPRRRTLEVIVSEPLLREPGLPDVFAAAVQLRRSAREIIARHLAG
jgi:acyl carrier protein